MRRSHWQTFLILLVLFLAGWLPRVLALDRFVTADERRWLTRSANFYQALTHGDWPHTFQREHPGVTIMWAGTLGFLRTYPAYAQEAPGQFVWEREALEEWLYAQTAHTPLELLAAGRWWVVLAVALTIAACFLPLRRLIGASAAILATLFIAWEPFFLALSRQLHPDGLVTSLTLLALLLFLAWLYGGRRWRYLASSAVIMGLAWLTKTPAIFLVPTGGLLAAGCWLLAARSKPAASRQQPIVTGFILWGALATVTFVALWPAMWLDPLGTLLRMSAEMSEYVEGHVNPNFFLGQSTADPDARFYPVAYWVRTTPATVVGLLAMIPFLWRRSRPFDQPTVRQTAGGLLLFAFVFALGMTVGAKKFDRYLLPAFPALDVLAALGWVAVGDWVTRRFGRALTPSPAHPLTWSPFLVVFALHGLPGFLHYPYYLTYYNPLAGGAAAAERWIMVGWGEGLDQAAAWINEQPEGETARVVSWYGDGPLSYFLQSREPVASFWSPEFWLDVDYAVVYISQWQRQIPDWATSEYFRNATPAHVVTIQGQEVARIYDLRAVDPPEFTALHRKRASALDDQLRLAGYQLGQFEFLAGEAVPIRLFLQTTEAVAPAEAITLRLRAADGSELWQEHGEPDQPPSAEGYLRYDETVAIPPGAATGQYTLTVQTEGEAVSIERVVTAIQIEAAKTLTLDADWGVVRLNSVGVEPTVAAGNDLLVTARAEGQTDGSLKLSARLVDASGALVGQADETLLPELQVAIPVPPVLAPGRYTLAVVIYDPQTLNPLPDVAGDFQTSLTEIQVMSGG
jgi:hypothetical protein